jgi:hypothetical protein
MRANEQKGWSESAQEIRVKVPCALSASGQHWVTVITGPRGELHYLSSDCTAADALAGEALSRLGGKVCQQVIAKVQAALRSENYSYYSNPISDVQPERLREYLRPVCERREQKHSERGKPKPSKDTLLERLATKWASKAAQFPVRVFYSKAGDLQLAVEDGWVAATRNADGVWLYDETKVLSQAESAYLRLVEVEHRCDACHEKYRNIKQHGRRNSHKQAVLDGIRRAIRLLRNARLHKAGKGV